MVDNNLESFLREILIKIEKMEEKIDTIEDLIEKSNYLFQNEEILKKIICNYKSREEIAKELQKDLIKKVFFGLLTFIFNAFLVGLIYFLIKIMK